MHITLDAHVLGVWIVGAGIMEGADGGKAVNVYHVCKIHGEVWTRNKGRAPNQNLMKTRTQASVFLSSEERCLQDLCPADRQSEMA